MKELSPVGKVIMAASHRKIMSDTMSPFIHVFSLSSRTFSGYYLAFISHEVNNYGDL